MAVRVAALDRRVKKEAKALCAEARTGLAKGPSMPGAVAADLKQRIAHLEQALAGGDLGEVRRRLPELDALVDEHVVQASKSVAREYTESILIALVIAVLLRAFVIEAFKIPSSSMVHTLEIGDHIFVNKFLYGIQIPFTQQQAGRVARAPTAARSSSSPSRATAATSSSASSRSAATPSRSAATSSTSTARRCPTSWPSRPARTGTS